MPPVLRALERSRDVTFIESHVFLRSRVQFDIQRESFGLSRLKSEWSKKEIERVKTPLVRLGQAQKPRRSRSPAWNQQWLRCWIEIVWLMRIEKKVGQLEVFRISSQYISRVLQGLIRQSHLFPYPPLLKIQHQPARSWYMTRLRFFTLLHLFLKLVFLNQAYFFCF